MMATPGAEDEARLLSEAEDLADHAEPASMHGNPHGSHDNHQASASHTDNSRSVSVNTGEAEHTESDTIHGCCSLLTSTGNRIEIEKPGLQTTNTHAKSGWQRLWRFEIISSVFSMSCMVIIAAILLAFDGKPLRDWRFQLITPNALIAIFSTMSKSAMLLTVATAISQMKWAYFQDRAWPLAHFQILDDASRGPLGAAKLLWSLRAQALVASVGALLTLTALAMDPFTQQILSFPTHEVEATNVTATLRKTSDFAAFSTAKAIYDPDDNPRIECKSAIFRVGVAC